MNAQQDIFGNELAPAPAAPTSAPAPEHQQGALDLGPVPTVRRITGAGGSVTVETHAMF